MEGSANKVGIALELRGSDILIGDGAEISSPDWIAAGKHRITLRLLTGVAVNEEAGLATRYDPVACTDSGWDVFGKCATARCCDGSHRGRWHRSVDHHRASIGSPALAIQQEGRPRVRQVRRDPDYKPPSGE